jgi:hypothetical protein
MFEDVILEVLHRSFSPDEKKCVPVVQHTHFIRSHQLSPRILIVRRIVAVSARTLSISVGVYGLFAEQFGYILMCLFLISSQVYELIMR